MPNANYVAGAAAERTVKRDLEQVGFSCIRAAASHGVYDVAGVRGDSAIFIQVKRGKTKPSPSEYQSLIDMPVPENALKMVVFYPVGSSARVIYTNMPLPDWCGFVRWFAGMPPKQSALVVSGDRLQHPAQKATVTPRKRAAKVDTAPSLPLD